MLKKLLLIGTLAFLASLNSASARLGYTLDECIKQYGTQYKSYDFGKSGTAYTWETNYFKISVSFAPGVSTVGLITYDGAIGAETIFLTGDEEKDYKARFAFFTADLIKELLEKNVPGANWKKVKNNEEPLETDYLGTKGGVKVASVAYFYHLFGKGIELHCSVDDHPQLSVETTAYKEFEDALANAPDVKATPEKSASADL
jgi:hypothetical protein